MSYEHQANYFSLAVKAEHLKNPDFMVVDIAAIEASAKKTREERAAQNPPAAVPARVEYNKLRQTLYSLTENVKHSGVRLSNDTDSVRHFEKLIDGYLKAKKACTKAALLGQERFLEARLVATESELKDAQAQLKGSQRNNTACVSALSNFEGHARLEELKAELGL
jgi:hypothetical protein